MPLLFASVLIISLDAKTARHKYLEPRKGTNERIAELGYPFGPSAPSLAPIKPDVAVPAESPAIAQMLVIAFVPGTNLAADPTGNELADSSRVECRGIKRLAQTGQDATPGLSQTNGDLICLVRQHIRNVSDQCSARSCVGCRQPFSEPGRLSGRDNSAISSFEPKCPAN